MILQYRRILAVWDFFHYLCFWRFSGAQNRKLIKNPKPLKCFYIEVWSSWWSLTYPKRLRGPIGSLNMYFRVLGHYLSILEKKVFFKKIDFLGCGTNSFGSITFFVDVRAPKFFFHKKSIEHRYPISYISGIARCLVNALFQFLRSEQHFWPFLKVPARTYFGICPLAGSGARQKYFRKKLTSIG